MVGVGKLRKYYIEEIEVDVNLFVLCKLPLKRLVTISRMIDIQRMHFS